MKNQLLQGKLLSLIVSLGLASLAGATPYATCITNTGSAIVFRLNESADSVKIIYGGGASTNDLGARGAGLHNIALAAVGAVQIEVSKNPGFGYLQGIPTQISVDTNKWVRFNAPRGVAVNRNPASPYFGRIYVANSDTGSVTIAGFPTRAMPQGDGIFMINADFTDAAGQGDVARTAGLNFRNPVVTDAANKPHRVEVGEDDNLYIGDYSNPTNPIVTGNIYVTDPDVGTNSSATNVLTFDAGVGGRIPSSVIAKGSLGGGNLSVYAIYPDRNFDYDFFGFPATSYSVMQRWDIGSGPLPYANPGVRVTDLPILIADVPSVLSDIDVAPDGKYFIAQNRSVGLEAGLLVVDPTRTSNWEAGYPDVVFDSYAESTLRLGATNDILRLTRAVKVAPDGSVVCLIRDDNQVWIIPLTNGVPDMSRRLLMATGSTTILGRDISFDAAGNLYIASSGQSAVKVFSPGFGSRAVTDSAGTFNLTRITNDPPQITISSTDTNLYERMANDTANFVVTRLGDISSALTVNLSYSGAAANGVDYGPAPASVTIPAYAISVTTTTAPINNASLTGHRVATVSIANGAGYTNGTVSSIDLLVRDDEQQPGPVIYSDDFDTDTSGSYVVRFGAVNGVDDKLVAFNYDYSADGIPSAPNSSGGSTRGLKVTVNKDATGSAAAVNVYPATARFSNDFALRFDMYQRYGAAAGTTEHALFGINHSTINTNRDGLAGSDGVWMASECDGSGSSSGRSYAIYTSTNSANPPPFTAVSARAMDPFFTAPPFTANGGPSGQWVDVEVRQTGNVIVWTINGVLIQTRTNVSAFTNGAFMLGHMDFFNSIGSPTNYTVFDNVRVINFTPVTTRITSVARSGGNIEIDFTAEPTNSPSAFTLESTTALPGGFGPDAGAVITGPVGNVFHATSTNSAGTRFFRIKK
jgi:hypothetical protein